MYRFLDSINDPKDIRSLSVEELKVLCSEIRDYMTRCCARNPGHLGSSLGAVEVIVALHYLYDTPNDKIVFDVGHQAYAHKIITGRREAFKANRTRDGLSGFPKISESPYDAFGAGHSSTSISAALGLAEAARMKGTNEKVVALIGDGAMTSGMAFEGLNNAGDSKADLLIILNDNDQSIDRNLGGMHNYLLKITSGATYNRIKNRIWNDIGEGRVRDALQDFTRNIKSSLVHSSGGDLFEDLGLRYFGPIDGNDLEQLIPTITRIKKLGGPRILHIHTLKGKGFAPAEKDPATWHAPGKFNPETGEREPHSYSAPRYQDVFGQTLVELAKMDSRVVGITPAMASGSSMNLLAEQMPERFFDVGIEEEHAVTFSAGLAAGGMRPFCNIYSSFAQRSYDQIIHDVALQNLPVVLCFDRAGLVGEDGATHNGVFDLSAYRSVPNATISAPRDELSLKNLMYSGLHSEGGPYIIRYPRGCAEGVPYKDVPFEEIPSGKGEKVREGSGIAILCLGPFAYRAMEAAERLQKDGVCSPAVYDMRFLRPLDGEILSDVAKGFKAVVTVEDGMLKGGLFGAVTEWMASNGHLIYIKGIGVPDEFTIQDRQASQRASAGLDADGIYRTCGHIAQKLSEI